MFISILDSILPENVQLDLPSILWVFISGVAIGLAVAFTYVFTHKKEGYLSAFPITLTMIPLITAAIILLIGNNTTRALSLAGIFALTRFRSNPLGTKEVAYVFLMVAIGIALGIGYIAYAVILAAVVCGLLIVLYFTRFGIPDAKTMRLKIIVPENVNYDNLFDDILDRYCRKYYLNKVRTTDFGTMFELVYLVVVKNTTDQKQFIDELRERNGNLNITLVVCRYNNDVI